jgi:hypothetical protein
MVWVCMMTLGLKGRLMLVSPRNLSGEVRPGAAVEAKAKADECRDTCLPVAAVAEASPDS